MKKWLLRFTLLALPFALLEIALRVAGIGQGIVYEEHPAYGYRPAPSQVCSTLGKPIHILPSGFRGPVGSSPTLMVGDSVTYGTATLHDGETFAALLGAVNGGVNGWGPLNIAAFLEHHPLDGFQQVVWILPTCDVLRPFMSLRDGLISTNRRMWLRLEYLYRFVRYGLLSKQPSPVDPAAFDGNREALLAAAEQIKARGLDFLVVFLPYRDEASGAYALETARRDELAAQLSERGIRHLLLQPPAEGPPLYRDAAHLTVDGNRWVADQLRPHVQAAGAHLRSGEGTPGHPGNVTPPDSGML